MSSGKTDPDLVAGALAGSQEDFRELVERYERPVFGLIARMVRDAALAEDLAQEVFLKMYRHLSAFDPARKFSSWLFKIAHNTTVDHLRRRPVEAVSIDAPFAGEEEARRLEILDSGAETPEGAHLRGELGSALDRAVALLRPAVREVMLLRFREGLAYEEIAAVTNLPLGTVKTFIFRGRKQMAEALTRAGWGPPGSETSPSGGS